MGAFGTDRTGAGIGFQGAGAIPFVTGVLLQASNFGTNNAEVHIRFPTLTNYVRVINGASGSSVPIRFHFTSLAQGNTLAGAHWVPLYDFGTEEDIRIPISDLYVSLASGSSNGFVHVIAQCTPLGVGMQPVLSGTGIDL